MLLTPLPLLLQPLLRPLKPSNCFKQSKLDLSAMCGQVLFFAMRREGRAVSNEL